MSIIGWLIMGAVAGWLASIVTKRNDSMNWFENSIAGIVGALVGGFLYGLLTDTNFISEFSLAILLAATVGAIIVLFIYAAVKGRS